MAKISHVEGAFRGTPHLFLATPTYTGKIDANYMYSLLYSIPKLQEAGIGLDHYVMSYNCHVDDARNGILRDFLLTDCTDLVFVDADVSWQPEALLKLAKYDRDVVAGVYPKRTNMDTDFPVRVEPGTTLQADKDGLVEVSGAPTGFMKIKRHVVEKMVKTNDHRRFRGQGAECGDEPYTIVFERTYQDGHRWSGDYNFCRQWAKMGGKIYVDPEMFLTHSGEADFSGTLGAYWKRKHGVDKIEIELKFNQAIENLKVGKQTIEDFISLSNGWGNPYSAGTELLIACYELAKQADPKDGPILETGSGLTTLIMALANPNITIHALEHEVIWGSRLKYFIEIYGIKNIKLHFDSLKEYGDGKWYNIETLPKDPFSLVLCDGPPRMISNRGIIYRELKDQIKDSVFLMDDADNDKELEPIRAWASTLGKTVNVLGRKRRFALA